MRVQKARLYGDDHHVPLFGVAASKKSVGAFYADSRVLVTGATGFVGKALLEKLLRTCDQVKTVHVLLRSKRGMSAQQRLQVRGFEEISSVSFMRFFCTGASGQPGV